MSYKIYIKQFDNDTVLKVNVTGTTRIYEIKSNLRNNGYRVQHLMKAGGFSILSDLSDLNSLLIKNKSVLMCLILPTNHYSLIPKQNIFNHSIIHHKFECNDGIKCKYYSFCLQYKCNNKIFNHMISTQHNTNNNTTCRNGAKCYAYQRCLTENGYKVDDRCHILAFTHPPKINYKRHLLQKKFNPFIYCDYMMKTKLFNLIIFPNNKQQIQSKQTAEKLQNIMNDSKKKERKNSNDIKHDYIDFLISEIVNNGYKNALFISTNEEKQNENKMKSKRFIDLSNKKYPSIMKVVKEKMNHARHIAYGKPLNYGEILALIVYTNCDFKYDMIQSLLFNSNVNKWKWFIFILDSAIEKLSKYEIGNVDLYSYITNYNIHMPMRQNVQHQLFICFGTFVDFYVNKQYIEKQYTKNNETGTMVKLFVDNNNNNIPDKNRRIFSGCCDISWLDKFSNETKVVFRPFATFYGYKIVEYIDKHIKMLLCHGTQIDGSDKW